MLVRLVRLARLAMVVMSVRLVMGVSVEEMGEAGWAEPHCPPSPQWRVLLELQEVLSFFLLCRSELPPEWGPPASGQGVWHHIQT